MSFVEKPSRAPASHPAAVRSKPQNASVHLVQTIVRTQRPPETAATPAPLPSNDHIQKKIKPQSLWRHVAEEVGRGAQKALKGVGWTAVSLGGVAVVTAVGASLAPGTFSDIADSLKSLLPDFSNSPENFGLAATIAGATALALASAARKKTAADAGRRFPRAASAVCQIVGGIVLPLAAGYAVYQGAQQYDAWTARPDPSIAAPQVTTTSLTPR